MTITLTYLEAARHFEEAKLPLLAAQACLSGAAKLHLTPQKAAETFERAGDLFSENEDFTAGASAYKLAEKAYDGASLPKQASHMSGWAEACQEIANERYADTPTAP